MRINREQGKVSIPMFSSSDPEDPGSLSSLTQWTMFWSFFVSSLLAILSLPLSPILGVLTASFPHLQCHWCWVWKGNHSRDLGKLRLEPKDQVQLSLGMQELDQKPRGL